MTNEMGLKHGPRIKHKALQANLVLLWQFVMAVSAPQSIINVICWSYHFQPRLTKGGIHM